MLPARGLRGGGGGEGGGGGGGGGGAAACGPSEGGEPDTAACVEICAAAGAPGYGEGTGPDVAGPDVTGSDVAGPDVAGSGGGTTGVWVGALGRTPLGASSSGRPTGAPQAPQKRASSDSGLPHLMQNTRTSRLGRDYWTDRRVNLPATVAQGLSISEPGGCQEIPSGELYGGL